VRNPRENVEAIGRATDDFADQFARHAGDHHAVPGEALHEIRVGPQPPEVRRAIQRDVEKAAPGVLDACLGELREHARDPLAQHLRRVEGIDAE